MIELGGLFYDAYAHYNMVCGFDLIICRSWIIQIRQSKRLQNHPYDFESFLYFNSSYWSPSNRCHCINRSVCSQSIAWYFCDRADGGCACSICKGLDQGLYVDSFHCCIAYRHLLWIGLASRILHRIAETFVNSLNRQKKLAVFLFFTQN